MPIQQDHPLRLRRIRAGLSQQELARRAGVSRSIVLQIEEGRVFKANDKVVSTLSMLTQTPTAQIHEDVKLWHDSRIPPLSNRAKNALQLPAVVVAKYHDFTQWREDIADNVTQFSSLLRISRNTIAKYEAGITRAMPKPLILALYDRLDLSDDYVIALTRLPHGPQEEEALNDDAPGSPSSDS